jgi:Uncharacterized conserved protein (DUF2039)
MPQGASTSSGGASGAPTKKKKKGRPPAHQNAFAFRHNPKSTKTAAILAAPIRHLCRRCHDKLVWRKTYRKYKPLTQASICNICRQRNVTAAYHTICTKCTVSSTTALSLLELWNNNADSLPSETIESDETTAEASFESMENVEVATNVEDSNASDAIVEDDAVNQHEIEQASEDAELAGTSASNHCTGNRQYSRVCAICVKQPALTDEVDDELTIHHNTVINPDGTRRPLKLRELKSIQRQQEMAQTKKKKVKSKVGDNDDIVPEEGDDDDHDDVDNNEETQAEVDQDDDDQSASSIDDDDPFLRAVGGANNLLTGEAYQQMLLRTGKLNLLPSLQPSHTSNV